MRYFICILICCSVLRSASAQSEFHLTHYSDENGLPQNTVNFITVDNAGFVWLSTEDGLVRFDGYHFKRLGGARLQSSSNRFRAFYRDSGRLYCHNSNYEQIRINDGQAILDTNIRHWLQYQKDITVQPKGIFKKNFKEADRFFDNGSINMNNLNHQSFKEIFILKNRDSLYRYNGHQLALFHKHRLTKTFPFRTGPDWKFFMAAGRLYSIGNNNELTDLTDGTFKKCHFTGDILQHPSFERENARLFLLWNICVDSHVILYLDQCFYLATPSPEGHVRTKLLFRGFDGPKNNICSAYYDPNSRKLFLGSSTKGLFVLSPKLFQTVTSEDGENIYYGQIEYQPNKILTIGPRSIHLSKQGIKFAKPDQLNPMTFFSMAKDSLSGTIWSIWHEWLYLVSATTLEKIKTWKMPLPINALCLDASNILWLGTINGELYRKSPEDKAPVLYGKCSGRISYLLPVNGKELYLGTENGLFKFIIKNKTVNTVTGLENKSVRSVYQSDSGDLWVTTYGNGFYYLKNDQAEHLPLDRDGFLRSSHYLLEDSHGYFWIPTNKGLFQVLQSDLLSYVHSSGGKRPMPYYYYYDKRNGFNTNEFNGGCQPCAVQLQNKLISMPSMNGLVLFDPDTIDPLLPDKRIYIDQILVDSARIEANGSITLPVDFTQLNISVSTPFFGNHKNLQISYALISARTTDTTWLPLAENGVIALSVLPSGTYALIIRKINGFGKCNHTEKVIQFTVRSKWYHSFWFGLALVMLLPFGGVIIGNSRSRYIGKRNRQLETLIEEKTRALKKRAHIQELIIKAIGHDIRTPLKYHMLLANKITEQAQKENSSIAGPTEILNASSKQIYQLIENFIHYLKVQNSTPAYRSKNIILNQVVNEKSNFFQRIAERRSSILLNIGTIEVTAVTDPQLLAIIIHNLIDNALKVVQDGLVTTEIGLTRLKMPFVSITDSGPGLNTALVDWLNKPAMEFDKDPASMPAGCGLGLLMIKQLAGLLRITLQVRASSETGTTVTLIFERPGHQSEED